MGEISEEFYGNFKDMLYDDDVPDRREVIAVLELISKHLKNYHVEQLAGV